MVSVTLPSAAATLLDSSAGVVRAMTVAEAIRVAPTRLVRTVVLFLFGLDGTSVFPAAA
jgi:hypothetical protein